MTEAVNKVGEVGTAGAELGPYQRLLALYASGASAEAAKLTIDMIAETAKWKKTWLKVGGKEGAALSKGIDWVCEYWLKAVAENKRPEVAELLRTRWVIAFAPKEDLGVNLKAELAAREAELEAAVKAKRQVEPEPAGINFHPSDLKQTEEPPTIEVKQQALEELADLRAGPGNLHRAISGVSA